MTPSVPYLSREPFIANTDRAWFDYLASRSQERRVDEVNFWLPKARVPMKQMYPGEPIFFRLKAPDRAIAGYGFFAHFQVLDLHTAWDVLSWKNGDPDACIGPSWTPGSEHCGQLDRSIVDTEIGVVDTEIGDRV